MRQLFLIASIFSPTVFAKVDVDPVKGDLPAITDTSAGQKLQAEQVLPSLPTVNLLEQIKNGNEAELNIPKQVIEMLRNKLSEKDGKTAEEERWDLSALRGKEEGKLGERQAEAQQPPIPKEATPPKKTVPKPTIRKASPAPIKRVKQEPIPYIPPPPIPQLGFNVGQNSTGGVFQKNLKYVNSKKPNIIPIPSGSTAKAVLKWGIKVSAETPRDVLFEVKELFYGPNNTRVELHGCKGYVRLRANFNIEALVPASQSKSHVGTLSCRDRSGGQFEIPMNAEISTPEGYQSIPARLVMNGKAQEALMTFTKDLVSGWGEAVKASNLKVDVEKKVVQDKNGNNEALPINQSQEVTGDKLDYIRASTVENAMGNFLNSFINHYKSLAPTLEVPSKTIIYINTKGVTPIPKSFFVQKRNNIGGIK